jgi:arabinose-5-phosphate isomerase
LHAGDALHGNLGVIRHDDILVAISVSGKSVELLPIIHYAQKVGAETVAISANSDEIVPRICDHVISIPRSDEGCAFGIAPFASTMATIAIGDALTVLAAERLQFSRTSMAELHPGGHIGQQLTPISETMICGARMPMVDPACSIAEIITEITAKGLGVTTIVDDQRRLLGLITDGDLRRQYDALQNQTAESIMTKQPLRVDVNIDRHAAMVLMRNHRVNILPVVGNDGITLVGLVHLQDLLRSGTILI